MFDLTFIVTAQAHSRARHDGLISENAGEAIEDEVTLLALRRDVSANAARETWSAPSGLRKQPETFCLTLSAGARSGAGQFTQQMGVAQGIQPGQT